MKAGVARAVEGRKKAQRRVVKGEVGGDPDTSSLYTEEGKKGKEEPSKAMCPLPSPPPPSATADGDTLDTLGWGRSVIGTSEDTAVMPS